MDVPAISDHFRAREAALHPLAARASTSMGRRRVETPSPLRSAFQEDHDRILHTKAFRRLKHKTQVFIAPQQDHYVTRLTHTLEVSNVARTIARALNLNEDLAEAAALGHDIGHGPFGHAGEEALAECLPEGFRHNYQSVRVLDRLENGGAGLNLTLDVLDAVEKSSKAREDILAEGWGVPATLEGQVVKIADAIAYLNHDILDAGRAGILDEDDLPDATRAYFGRSSPERLDAMMGDVVEATATEIAAGRALAASGDQIVRFTAAGASAANELREFMFQRVYYYDATRADAERGKAVVIFLFRHFVVHPEAISLDFSLPDDPLTRRAADFVSGMTDRYALRIARSLGCADAMAFPL